MNKNIILAAVVLIAALGLWWFASNNVTGVETLSEVAELDSTQLVSEGDGAESVTDNRTPEEIVEQEGAPAGEEATTSEEGELPVDTTEGELVGGDAVAPVETAGEKSFTVLGSNFAYDLSEIRVQEGDLVTITFRSSDGFHDWVVDEFDAATEKVTTGNETTVTFVADKTGEFEYYCSVGSHRAQGMVGTLIVE